MVSPSLEEIAADRFAKEDGGGLGGVQRFRMAGHGNGDAFAERWITDAVGFVADDQSGLFKRKLLFIEKGDVRLWKRHPELFAAQ